MVVGIDSESTDPVDPLVDYSSLSLFPRSFNSTDLQSHLTAMELRSPGKLLKQAETILGSSSELLNTEKTSDVASEDRTDFVLVANERITQDRRPALGLKRAKFSVKPMSSQPAVVLEPHMDINKLEDPEEFFAAFERMENAKKELGRLRGQPLVDLDQNRNLSTLSPRRRRPSLLGKSATYKHRPYPSKAIANNSETLLSSQETFDHGILNPSHMDVLPETNPVNVSPHVRVSDSTARLTSEVNELDELLSCDYEGLDEAGVEKLLQEKLQIKIIDNIGKPSLPDLNDACRRESETSYEALPSVNGMNKTISSEPLVLSNQLRESCLHPRASSAKSKSPLVSISLLNRQISKLSPSNDPFSALDIDFPPAKIFPPELQHGKQSDQTDTRKNLYESRATLVHGEESTVVASPSILESSDPKRRLDEVSQSDQVVTRKYSQESGGSPAEREGSIVVSSERSPLSAPKVMPPTSEPKEQVDKVSQSDLDGARKALRNLERSPEYGEKNVANLGLDSLVFAAEDGVPTNETEEREDEEAAVRDRVLRKINFESSTMEESRLNSDEEFGIGEASNVEDICTEEPTKEKEKSKLESPSQENASKKAVKQGRKAKAQSDVPVDKEPENKRRKVEGAPPGARRREQLNRRQSLIEAGTKWEAGVRRSTRIRMRPLEYWKGERFLYGRVHESLVTVIGVKYASPSTKEAKQPAVKVKSFVDDKYKNLVDLAASY